MRQNKIDPATREALWAGFRSGRLVAVLGRRVQEHLEELPSEACRRQLLVEGLAGSEEGGAPISLASLERLADLWQVEAPWASPFRWAAGLVSEAHDRLGLFDPAEDLLPALVMSELCCAVLRQLTRPEGAEARRVGPWEIQDRGEDYDDPKTVLALAIDEAWPVLWRILREAGELE